MSGPPMIYTFHWPEAPEPTPGTQ